MLMPTTMQQKHTQACLEGTDLRRMYLMPAGSIYALFIIIVIVHRLCCDLQTAELGSNASIAL